MKKSIVYIALEDFNLEWKRWEVMAALHYWNEGLDIVEISSLVKRDMDELALLLIDIAEFKPGLVRQRLNGIVKSPPLPPTTYYNTMMENLLEDNEVYVVFEQTGPNLIWWEREVYIFDELWSQGYNIMNLAKRFKKSPLETCLLIIDRCKKDFIHPRDIGLGI